MILREDWVNINTVGHTAADWTVSASDLNAISAQINLNTNAVAALQASLVAQNEHLQDITPKFVTDSEGFMTAIPGMWVGVSAGTHIVPTTGAGTGIVTVDRPAGTQNGDMLFAFEANANGTASQLTAPAGFNVLESQDQGASNLHVKLFNKTAASESATYNFGTATTADTVVICVALRNSTFVDSTIVAQVDTSTTRTAPSISFAGELLLCFAASHVNNTASNYVVPAGMVSVADITTQWIATALAVVWDPPNPTGTRAFTLSSTPTANGGIQASVVVA